MCERVGPPDPPDAALDSRELVDVAEPLDSSTDIGFRPRPGLDAAADADEPDGVTLLPTPAPDPPSSHADAWRLTVSSAAAPATAPDGRPWDVDSPPDLRVDIETRRGVILQTIVATDSYRAEFTDGASARVSVTESLRFVLHDVDESTLTGPQSDVVIECAPRVTDEIRESGGVLHCRSGDASIEVRAEALVRDE